ncbi:MAG: HDIG domain-containing protein, partial [Clostridia bacterium]|nr:HDIG domain-containing protein [Clostridia bacterium]
MTRKKSRPASKFGSVLSHAMLGAAVFIVLFALLSAAITPERYDIQVGQPAPNTIKATKDVEDTITTQEEKAKAANQVRSIYIKDENAAVEVLENAGAKFKVLSQVAALSRANNEDGTVTSSQLSSANEQLFPVSISADELSVLSTVNEDELKSLFARSLELLEERLKGNLMEDNLAQTVEDIANSIVNDYDMRLISVVGKTLESVIRPNYFFDEAATKAARKAEMDKVKTITRIKGEVIVSDGEIVTEAHYEMLYELGIVKESNLDITLYYGVAVLVLLLMTAVIMYISLYDPEIMKSLKALFMLALISVIVVGVSVLVRDISPYLMPTTLGILLVSQLVKRRLAIVMNVVLSVGISLFASSSTGFFNMAMFTIVVNSIVGGMAALLVLKKKQQRTTTLIAGVAVGLSNMVCTVAIGLVNNANLRNVFIMAEWSAGSGILASILCIALMPILEGAFNIVTPNKLLELSNPNQPLLRRLLLEAPGTYHHSIIVANLAEAAAGEIGANALLARVGAYYHDVGKLKRPSYFKENQMGDNPHDRTDPRVSTAILTAHTRDAVRMLQRERIPEPIIAIVASHHGDTPVMYFYNKSRMENGDDVKIDDFRYDGPRPQSKEAAIVML